MSMLPHRKGEETGAILIAEILVVHVHEGIAGKSPHGKTIVDIDKFEPIARLGGNFYGRIKEVFELTRPNDEEMYKRQEEYRKQVMQLICIVKDFVLAIMSVDIS